MRICLKTNPHNVLGAFCTATRVQTPLYCVRILYSNEGQIPLYRVRILCRNASLYMRVLQCNTIVAKASVVARAFSFCDEKKFVGVR